MTFPLPGLVAGAAGHDVDKTSHVLSLPAGLHLVLIVGTLRGDVETGFVFTNLNSNEICCVDDFFLELLIITDVISCKIIIFSLHHQGHHHQEGNKKVPHGFKNCSVSLFFSLEVHLYYGISFP